MLFPCRLMDNLILNHWRRLIFLFMAIKLIRSGKIIRMSRGLLVMFIKFNPLLRQNKLKFLNLPSRNRAKTLIENKNNTRA